MRRIWACSRLTEVIGNDDAAIGIASEDELVAVQRDERSLVGSFEDVEYGHKFPLQAAAAAEAAGRGGRNGTQANHMILANGRGSFKNRLLGGRQDGAALAGFVQGVGPIGVNLKAIARGFGPAECRKNTRFPDSFSEPRSLKLTPIPWHGSWATGRCGSAGSGRAVGRVERECCSWLAPLSVCRLRHVCLGECSPFVSGRSCSLVQP